MRKPASYWPERRSLFRHQGKRTRTLMWITLVLAVGGAGVVVALSRTPPV